MHVHDQLSTNNVYEYCTLTYTKYKLHARKHASLIINAFRFTPAKTSLSAATVLAHATLAYLVGCC